MSVSAGLVIEDLGLAISLYHPFLTLALFSLNTKQHKSADVDP